MINNKIFLLSGCIGRFILVKSDTSVAIGTFKRIIFIYLLCHYNINIMILIIVILLYHYICIHKIYDCFKYTHTLTHTYTLTKMIDI